MQFFRHFLLLPYKIGIKELGFRSANFNKTFPKINIETKLCYLLIGKICEGWLRQLLHRQIDCM